MTAKKKHRIIYIIAFCICSFILADANYSPLRQKAEKVRSVECLIPRYGRHGYSEIRNYIGTKDHVYDLTARQCLPVTEGDTIIVSRSAITHALAFLEIHNSENHYLIDISYVNGRTGKFWIYIVLFLTIVFFFFHDKLGNETGKGNMAYFLFLCSLALLIQDIFNIW